MTAPAQDDDRDGVAEAMGGLGDEPTETTATDATEGDLGQEIADAVEGDGGSMPG